MEIALRFAEEAVEIAPCYYVTGNHEARVTEYDDLKEGLISLGVVVLEEERFEVKIDEESIVLLGVMWVVWYIPSLELVIQEGEAFGHEKIQGYKREMLLEIWGEPVESGSGEDIWTIGPGSAMVRVNYNWQDEAVTLGVIPAVSEKSE